MSPPRPSQPDHRSAPAVALASPPPERSTGFSPSRSFPMSSTHLATALVVRFEQLRMTDVEAVGGKNASLGEMISQLAASRRARARRLRHHGARVPRVPRRTAAWPSASATRLADARHRRRARAGRRPAREIRALDRATQPLPADARGGDPRDVRQAWPPDDPDAIVRGALVGHRRRPARRVVRRPAGDLPQRRAASTTCCTR